MCFAVILRGSFRRVTGGGEAGLGGQGTAGARRGGVRMDRGGSPGRGADERERERPSDFGGPPPGGGGGYGGAPPQEEGGEPAKLYIGNMSYQVRLHLALRVGGSVGTGAPLRCVEACASLPNPR